MAHPLDNWRIRLTNSSSYLPFTHITYGNGLFVAVGNSGQVAVSPDGRSWTTNRPVTKPLHDVAYGAGQFIAVGDDSTILSSSDGANWVPRNSSVGTSFTQIEYGNGRFVGVGSATGRRAVFVSMDGAAWSIQASNYPYAGDLCFGNGLFLQSESTGTNLLTLDGTNWWRQPTGISNNLYVTRFAGGTFVQIDIGNRLYGSTDGTNWTLRGIEPVIRPEDLAYGNGCWVLVSISGKPTYSTDLTTWKTAATGTGIDCVAFGNGTFAGAYNNFWQSDPVILLQAAAANTFYLSGPTNVAYQIQALDGLGGNNSWSTIVSNLTISTSPALWSDPDSFNHPQRFYRALLP